MSQPITPAWLRSNDPPMVIDSEPWVEPKNKCWRLRITFYEDEHASIDIWAESHKKAVKAFEEGVQALKDGKQLPVGLHYSVVARASRTLNWKITKVRSL